MAGLIKMPERDDIAGSFPASGSETAGLFCRSDDPRVPMCLLRPPAELWPQIRAEQNAFREQFAEHFQAALSDEFWAGCSEDGSLVGFQFASGGIVKARGAVPVQALLQIIGQLQIVAEIAGERCLLARETRGVG